MAYCKGHGWQSEVNILTLPLVAYMFHWLQIAHLILLLFYLTMLDMNMTAVMKNAASFCLASS